MANGEEFSFQIDAYGISTLYACEALAENGKPAKHIVIDPFQHQYWGGVGLNNVAKAGYEHLIEFLQEPSEIALPSLTAAGTRAQAAIIDGNHRFDHALVDFFYVNKMLDIGGIVILDDTDHPSVSRLVKHILTYPSYEVFAVVGQPNLAPVTCMAFQKIAKDDRRWDWHVEF